MGRKLRNTLIIIVLLAAGAAVWQFGLRQRMALFQQWEGAIEETYRIRNVSKETFSPHGKDNPLWYDYYWRVRKDDGTTIDVEVPIRIWSTASIKQRWMKKSWTRWPQLVQPETAIPAASTDTDPQNAPAPEAQTEPPPAEG